MDQFAVLYQIGTFKPQTEELFTNVADASAFCNIMRRRYPDRKYAVYQLNEELLAPHYYLCLTRSAHYYYVVLCSRSIGTSASARRTVLWTSRGRHETPGLRCGHPRCTALQLKQAKLQAKQWLQGQVCNSSCRASIRSCASRRTAHALALQSRQAHSSAFVGFDPQTSVITS